METLTKKRLGNVQAISQPEETNEGKNSLIIEKPIKPKTAVRKAKKPDYLLRLL